MHMCACAGVYVRVTFSIGVYVRATFSEGVYAKVNLMMPNCENYMYCYNKFFMENMLH